MAAPDRKKLLEAFEDLRVTDTRDGLDTLMRHFSGSMDPNIRPLFRARAFGIARTVRYVPYTGTIPQIDPVKYWREWTPMFYRDICSYPWMDRIQEGDFVVIDQSGLDVGLMGSENTLNCKTRGARGLVTNGGVRDTDEIIMQQIPFWSLMISQTMVQGRLQFDAMDIPVSVGGVTVKPGDMVVADGDGVIAIPSDIALDVARWAHEEHERDKKNRKGYYDKLGWKADATVS
jgi:4-hydroxy-4-methyl-2-oxoglutarate aldolase